MSGGSIDLQKFTDSPGTEFEESVSLYEGGDNSGTDTGRVRCLLRTWLSSISVIHPVALVFLR